MTLVHVAKVADGTLFRHESTIWVEWNNGEKETWTLPNNNWGLEQTEENFNCMRERWSV